MNKVSSNLSEVQVGGDKVRRYFSHMDSDGYFVCFESGSDEWSNDGHVVTWTSCIPWAEGCE